MARNTIVALVLSLMVVPVLYAQQWQVWDMGNSPLPSTTVKALCEDGSGGVWVGTDWGLCHFGSDETWELYQMENSSLPTNDVNALVVDAQGRLWIATTGGLVMKDGTSWTTFTTENSPIPESGARGLFVDHLDRIWIATPGGLARITGSEWDIFDDTPESHGGLVLNTNNTRCVAVRPDGLVCLGTFNGGLHFITETSVDFLTTFSNGFFDNTATGVLFDPVNGDRWVATPAAGLLRQQGPANGGTWFQWNSSIGFPSNGITCLDMDPQRRVWAGTQIFGLVRVETDGTFVQFTEAGSGLPDDEVRSVLAADDGTIWVGTTYGGLGRYSGEVGISEGLTGSGVRIYPNPAREQATVEIGGRSETLQWELFNAGGALVAQGRAPSGRFQVSVVGLVPGIHVLRLIGSTFVETMPLVVEE